MQEWQTASFCLLIQSVVETSGLFSVPEMSVIKNAESARLFVLDGRRVVVIPVCFTSMHHLKKELWRMSPQDRDAFSNDACILLWDLSVLIPLLSVFYIVGHNRNRWRTAMKKDCIHDNIHTHRPLLIHAVLCSSNHVSKQIGEKKDQVRFFKCSLSSAVQFLMILCPQRFLFLADRSGWSLLGHLEMLFCSPLL